MAGMIDTVTGVCPMSTMTVMGMSVMIVFGMTGDMVN